jgi:hypothetical protein
MQRTSRLGQKARKTQRLLKPTIPSLVIRRDNRPTRQIGSLALHRIAREHETLTRRGEHSTNCESSDNWQRRGNARDELRRDDMI